jgi:hypothetical protein
MSYNGGMDFGLLADHDSMEDVDVIATGIEASIQELLAATPATDPDPRAEPTEATR